MNNELVIEQIGDRRICVSGVGKMFYQDGFPLSMSISELKKHNIEVSFYHLINELWDNGWSWKTIESKLTEEMADDIDREMIVDIDKLRYFYDCLEQPKRGNGGYEESRAIIHEYLFSNNKSLASAFLFGRFVSKLVNE